MQDWIKLKEDLDKAKLILEGIPEERFGPYIDGLISDAFNNIDDVAGSAQSVIDDLKEWEAT